ncbi:hypothetical protein [Streptomyces sp. NPDC017086]|uniref:hypothetical protein n=1 Tax=Streptomyces sp. NPDC017086 TaxID=3364976 RepID=UPI0037A421E6
MSAPTTAQWLRTAVDRVAVGSGRLATDRTRRAVQRLRRTVQRTRAWVGEASGVDKLIRLAPLALAALILRAVGARLAEWAYDRIESGAWWWLLAAGSAAWIVAAYRAGRDGWQPTPPLQPVPAGGEGGPVEAEPSPPAAGSDPVGPPPVSPVALVAAVRDIGTPHAQLKPLAEHLGVSTDAVRAAAAGMGWPVKDVRMTGRSASAGLRWDEVPSPPPLGPSPGVVGAGQRADDNDDDSGRQGPREGIAVRRTDGGLVIYDLADTHRRRGTVSR